MLGALIERRREPMELIDNLLQYCLSFWAINQNGRNAKLIFKFRPHILNIPIISNYDVCNLERVLAGSDEESELLAHRTLLYYASLSARFPQPLAGRTERFADREAELESQLLPMLREKDARPTLGGLMATAERFIETRVLPRTDDEREYLDLFAAGEYRPALIFPDERMAAAAEMSPAALWKLQNLRKMGA